MLRALPELPGLAAAQNCNTYAAPIPPEAQGQAESRHEAKTGPAAVQLPEISGEDLRRHLARDIGEPEITPAVGIGERLMIEAHQGQQGGVEIIGVHLA